MHTRTVFWKAERGRMGICSLRCVQPTNIRSCLHGLLMVVGIRGQQANKCFKERREENEMKRIFMCLAWLVYLLQYSRDMKQR